MRVRLLDDFDPASLPEVAVAAEHVLPNGDATGPLAVRPLVREHAAPDRTPILLLTARDLALPGCASLFGYADRRRQIAVVSSFRLGQDADSPRLQQRLTNVIAHEYGHLRGLTHCRERTCLMHAAARVEDVDQRSVVPCPRCRKPRPRFFAAAAAVAVSALAFAALDSLAVALRANKAPFDWRTGPHGAELLYEGHPAPGPSAMDARSARTLVASLNRMFQQLESPFLDVVPEGDSAAVVRAGGVPLLRVTAGNTGGQAPDRFAQSWVERIEPVIQGKGQAAESCPDCHLRRGAEVESWVRDRLKRTRRK